MLNSILLCDSFEIYIIKWYEIHDQWFVFYDNFMFFIYRSDFLKRGSAWTNVTPSSKDNIWEYSLPFVVCKIDYRIQWSPGNELIVKITLNTTARENVRKSFPLLLKWSSPPIDTLPALQLKHFDYKSFITAMNSMELTPAKQLPLKKFIHKTKKENSQLEKIQLLSLIGSLLMNMTNKPRNVMVKCQVWYAFELNEYKVVILKRNE